MARSKDATLITSAQRGTSLDLEARQRRYLITMGIRTACFFAFLIVPGWWKVACLLAAAILPAVGVLLANNADHHAPEDPQVAEQPRNALPGNTVLSGRLADDDEENEGP